MTENYPAATRRRDSQHYHEELSEVEEVSLSDALRTVWGLRGRIVLVFAICMSLSALVLVLVLLMLPSRQVHRQPFRINFASALSNQYPNGLPFQPADIVSPTVMRRVYEELKLEPSIDFNDFKASFSVREFNTELEAIRLEYQAKLANNKLTQAERNGLEEEYGAKRKAARTGEFELMYMNNNLVGLASASLPLIMNRILEAWAEEARNEKGAYLYDVTVLTERFYDRSLITGEEYVTSLDMIRQSVRRLLENVEEMEGIPGIRLVRVSGGVVGLAEVKIWLQDLSRFQIDPLIGRIRSDSAHKDIYETLSYLEDQLFNLDLDVGATADLAKALSEVLRAYQGNQSQEIPEDLLTLQPSAATTVAVPQVGEGFIDRLVELSVTARDVDYRRKLVLELLDAKKALIKLQREQAFYQSMVSTLTTDPVKPPPAVRVTLGADKVAERFGRIMEKIDEAVRALNQIYLAASSRSLQPTQAYTVTGPTLVSSGLPLGKAKLLLILLAGAGLASAVTIGLVILQIGRHHAAKRRSDVAE